MLVRVFLYMLHCEGQNKYFNNKVRILEIEDVFAGSHNFKGLFEDRLGFRKQVTIEFCSGLE